MIPRMEYTASASGATLKEVKCAGCGAEYFYHVERCAEGHGNSIMFLDNAGASQRAEAAAQKSLERRLAKAVELVPCPACGLYQPEMVAKARRQYRTWMLAVAFVCIVGTVVVGLFTLIAAEKRPVNWTLYAPILAVTGLAGIGILITRFVQARAYNPNQEDVEQRKRCGQERALRKEDLERLRREQQGEQKK